MAVYFSSEDISFKFPGRTAVKQWIKFIIETEHYIAGNIGIIFCSDNYLLKVNMEYLQHDFFTDIITFDYSENNIISGDLFISADRVRENAKLFSTEPYNELLRVIAHGILHLARYEDNTPSNRKMMTGKENMYLQAWEKLYRPVKNVKTT